MAVTSKDIARHLDLDQSTVSLALRGKRGSAETIRRVQEAARQLGYRPNMAGRTLKTGRTNTVGLVVPDIRNPHFAEHIGYFQDEALARGMHIVLDLYHGEASEANQYFEVLIQEGRVDALIVLVPMQHRLSESVNAYTDTGGTVVYAGEFTGNPHVHSVLLDFKPASRDLAKHLFDLGHRRVGTILGTYPAPPLPYEVHEQRFEEVYDYYAAQGCPLDRAYYLLCETSLAGGYAAACRLLDLDPRPTVIFAVNDLLATAVLKAAHDRGLRVPEDLSVAGCDNTELGRFHDLTTMDTAPKARAKEAFSILQRVVIDGEAPVSQIVRRAPSSLLIRSTTGPVPS